MRFAGAALLAAVVVWVLSRDVFDSSIVHAAVVTALHLGACAGVAVFMRRTYTHAVIGLCNLVTLLRLGLTMSLVTPLLAGTAPPVWGIFTVGVLALSLDGVDGWLARRQGLSSTFGARFDMEVDSALSLVLALNALVAGSVGPAVLVLGVARYVFGAAGLAFPWLARPLPDRFGRKVACVLQIGALIAVQAPILSPALGVLAVVVATLALAWSFGRDVLWLWRRRA